MTISMATRDFVAKRAKRRCEYCRLADDFSTHTFHVDHIIASKHQGSDDISNLAWSCLHCNLHKGSDVASFDSQTGQLTPLFHPRKNKWDNHFELTGHKIIGKTPIGRVTIHILQMNSDSQILIRQPIIDSDLW